VADVMDFLPDPISRGFIGFKGWSFPPLGLERNRFPRNGVSA